jgi:hypothetical protein
MLLAARTVCCVSQPTRLWTGPLENRRTLCDAISRLLGEPTTKEDPMGKVSTQAGRRPQDCLSGRESVTDPARRSFVEITGSGGHS